MSSTNILDGYHGDAFNFAKLKQEGIIAIIHKATQSTGIIDTLYKSRRTAAKQAGLLWGAYHFATDSDWEDQVKHFLDFTEPGDDEVIAWDYENPPAGQGHAMSFGHVHDAVELIFSLAKRFPMLYGGELIRDNVGDKQDAILKNCPLWYARYRSAPVGVPKGTWPAATLWQYTAAEGRPTQMGLVLRKREASSSIGIISPGATPNLHRLGHLRAKIRDRRCAKAPARAGQGAGRSSVAHVFMLLTKTSLPEALSSQGSIGQAHRFSSVRRADACSGHSTHFLVT